MSNNEQTIADKVKRLRKEYQAGFVLDLESVPADPSQLFSNWFDMAVQAGIVEPNAMVLATVDSEGRPSARVVLMKEFTQDGIGFYSNYSSRKGVELAQNRNAAVVFFWPDLERQVRIEGSVVRVSREKSESYFHSRPRGSQLGAAASHQSQVVPDRAALEREHSRLDADFQDTEIPCPPDWGGYTLSPKTYEFWQGKRNRLHDRIRYRQEKFEWIMERLAP